MQVMTSLLGYIGRWMPTIFLIVSAVIAIMAIGRGAGAEQKGPYLLRAGDTVEVIVLEDPELTRRALVRPDGKISLPIAGTLTAEGRSPEQLQSSIRSRLTSNFIEPPSVTVSLVGIALEEEIEEVEEVDDPREFYVVGEVARPGRFEYPSDKTISVLQALTVAGGLNAFAARKRIQVREVVEEGERVRLFNYEAVEDGSGINPDDLATLADGAIIIVPERGLFE